MSSNESSSSRRAGFTPTTPDRPCDKENQMHKYIFNSISNIYSSIYLLQTDADKVHNFIT